MHNTRADSLTRLGVMSTGTNSLSLGGRFPPGSSTTFFAVRFPKKTLHMFHKYGVSGEVGNTTTLAKVSGKFSLKVPANAERAFKSTGVPCRKIQSNATNENGSESQ